MLLVNLLVDRKSLARIVIAFCYSLGDKKLMTLVPSWIVHRGCSRLEHLSLLTTYAELSGITKAVV